MAFKLYSIESRKGGVGKTTIAMNLAKQLLKSGPVLLLDCDITGTSISDPATNSVYWKEDANVLRNEDGTPFNLLGFFLDNYIKGNGSMVDFTKEGVLLEKKINVIGSQLYAPTARSIVDTRILMDEIHSFWLMGFVIQLITSFEKRFSDKEVHVIIDNSPGYVGFCQALHNAMFQLGPSKAKYLMVSSMDEQDLKSCIYACSEIKGSINDRIKIARYFKDQIENSSSDSELESLIKTKSDLKRFYFNLAEDKALLENYTVREYTEKDYLTIILNKVPKSLEEDGFDYAFENVLSPEEYIFFKAITSYKNDIPQTIIYYDEAISFQYYWKYLKNSKDDAGKDPYWTRRFRDLLAQNEDIKSVSDRINAIEKQEGIYQALVSSLGKHGYSRLAKSFPASWSPSYTYEQFVDVINRISRRWMVYRRSEVSPTQYNNLVNRCRRELETVQREQHGLFDSDDLTSLYLRVLEIVKEENEGNNYRSIIIMVLFLHITLMLLKKSVSDSQDLRAGLISELRKESKRYDWAAYLDQELVSDLRIEYNSESVRRYFDFYFNQFYQLFCRTLIRMMDMYKDYKILVEALKLYVPNASPLMFDRSLISYLTEVMVMKTIDYDANEVMKFREESFMMKRVMEVLRDTVLKNWR